jgi:hypothetical protein
VQIVVLSDDFFSDCPHHFRAETISRFLRNAEISFSNPRVSFLLIKFSQSAAHHVRHSALITPYMIDSVVAAHRPDYLAGALPKDEFNSTIFSPFPE